MRPHTPVLRRFTRTLTACTLPLLLTLGLLMAGCATRRQVAEIIAHSNASMLAGQIGLPDAAGGSDRAPWQEAVERIDAFVVAHPDQPDTTAPLRIRQAMLLLAYRQFGLAEAAFNAAAPTHLHTDRDKALKRQQATLLWWFATSTNETWTAADQASAETAMAALKEEQAALEGSPEIRDYLAEMRAWIGLAAAKQTVSASRARVRLEDALDVYAAIFTADDLGSVAGVEQRAAPGVLGPEVRRRLRARPVLAQAKKQNQQDRLGAHPQNATFNRLINE